MPLAITNHMNTKHHRCLNPDEEFEDEEGALWEITTYQRQAKMLKVLRKLPSRNISLDRIFTRIGEPILNEMTAYAVLRNIANGDTLIMKE